MQKILLSILMILTVSVFSNYAYSQEIGLATFQETAQIVMDQSISQNVTASITLQSTSIQEIRIPAELEEKIRENNRIQAVIITNQNQCVLGVFEESCILINVERDHEIKGIRDIQDNTKEIADTLIDDINQAFDLDVKFHSVYVHTSDQTNTELGTSGVISGKGIISAVYTMTMEDTDSMYEKISAILVPKVIRDQGGFYNIAKNLSFEEKAKTTFSIIPLEAKSLLQLKLSIDYPGEASNITKISPLEYLKADSIKRSKYFAEGNYPLNSIIQVVVLSPEDTFVSNIQGNIIPTQIIQNEKIPTTISEPGWIFDPEEGQRIQGKYIFGEETIIDKETLEFTLGDVQIEQPVTNMEVDESIVIVVIISIIAIASALFYLKGYRK